jgi:hypothetical protein
MLKFNLYAQIIESSLAVSNLPQLDFLYLVAPQLHWNNNHTQHLTLFQFEAFSPIQ